METQGEKVEDENSRQQMQMVHRGWTADNRVIKERSEMEDLRCQTEGNEMVLQLQA